jgi:hypothetical protein
VALAIAGPLVLLGARRFPGTVVIVVTLLASADFVLADPTPGPPYVALAFAIVGAIVRGARVWAWISVGVAWTTPMVSLESAAGNRHFSTNRPTFAGLRVFSAELYRHPAGSWLYVGQSAGSGFDGPWDKTDEEQTPASTTNAAKAWNERYMVASSMMAMENDLALH